MRVLVLGAYGLLGSHVLARLHQGGHEIVAVGRTVETARRRFPFARWVAADLAEMGAAEAWAPLLEGVGAVVNCAGALQDSPRDDLRAVHAGSVRALVRACETAGVRRFVQVSAAGVGRAADTAFGRTKHEAEEALKASGLDWVILRPGLVLAPGAYGGSALLRGLAGLPFATPLVHGDSVVQVVAVSDVALTVARSIESGAPARVSWDLVHPARTSLADIVRAIRAWLGLPPRPLLAVSPWLAAPVSRFADALAWLGWRSPLRTAAMRQLAAGVTGDPREWISATGIKPLSLSDMLAVWPSGVEDRWFARTYFLKPLALAALGLFWTSTGLAALGPGFKAAVGALAEAGLPATPASVIVAAGALLDIALGLGVAARRTAPAALAGMVLVSAAYLAGGTWLRPDLWLDPLGVLAKIVPATFAALFALAVSDDR